MPKSFQGDLDGSGGKTATSAATAPSKSGGAHNIGDLIHGYFPGISKHLNSGETKKK